MTKITYIGKDFFSPQITFLRLYFNLQLFSYPPPHFLSNIKTGVLINLEEK